MLYVDDDPGLRRLVQRALERRGFTVTTAGGAEEGLALLAAKSFDLVAVDHHMPGRTGRELLDDIVALPDHPPVVFVTGNDDTSVAVEAMHAGASDFVVKTVGESFFDLLSGRFHQAFARGRLERDKRRAEQELRAANERLQMLVREVHHRVANSLQMVSSFVAMQAAQTRDEGGREALTATQNRIQAIAKVHHGLYTRGDITTIALDDYLATLVSALRESVEKGDCPITLTLTAAPIEVPPDAAVAVGVIVNELVTNAFKYAFERAAGGQIAIALSGIEGGGYSLTVSDDGRGFDDSAPAMGTGLGMRIVTAMAKSLGGELKTLTPGRGTTFRLTVAAPSIA
nr:response regulator [Qipengyuania sediminis]